MAPARAARSVRPMHRFAVSLLRAGAVLALAVGVLLAAAAPTDATRRPTSKEARAIRAAALRTLDGPGWKVDGIRVSTAKTRNRYARANVELRPDGPGGLMLLGTKRGRWRRLFLGTNDFCEAPVPKRVLADFGFACGDPEADSPGTDVTVEPAAVARGAALVVGGSGFLPGVSVTLLAGPPQSEAEPVATVAADASGAFRHTITTSPAATPGAYTVVACQRACTIKATEPFSITP